MSQRTGSSSRGLFAALTKRALNVQIFKSHQETVDALGGLLLARTLLHHRSEKQTIATVNAAFVKLCRRDVAAIADVMQKSVSLDVASPNDGRAASLLAYSLPKVDDCDEVLWEQIVGLCQRGCAAGHWHPQDVRSMVSQIAFWGAYDPSIIASVEKYVAARVRTCSESDLGYLALTLAGFTELQRSPLFVDVANRVIALSEHLSTSSLTRIVQALHRAQYWCNEALVGAVQHQGIRFAEDCDLYSATQMYCYLSAHNGPWIDTDVVKCLVERIVSDEGGLDANTVMALARSTKHFPKERRKELAGELDELLQFVSREVQGLVTTSLKEGGIRDEQNIDNVQSFVSRYLAAVEAAHVAGRGKTHPDVTAALDAVAEFVNERVEDFIASENPPFSLIPHLLHAPSDATRAAAVGMMREAALQSITYPTLQTYRFLLALGDHQIVDKRVFRHLRNQFAQTVKGIPMIQLCAALKCFVRGLNVEWIHTSPTAAPSPQDGAGGSKVATAAVGFVEATMDDIATQVQRELELEDLAAFLVQCHETIAKGFSSGVDVRCVLSLSAGMYQLGYKEDAFYNEVVAYLQTKVALASPNIHSVRDALMAKEVLGVERLRNHPATAAFLDDVVAQGTKDDHLLTPSQWMNEYDPANHITPLTEEQQRGWYILEQMGKTRSADTERLGALAVEYMGMLTLHRPDDLKAFFAMFEEKVFKNDRLLKDCMDHLCDLGIIVKLSGSTIANILHSLAAIRFSFYGAVKRFLLAVSEEQWSSLDAAVLVQVVSGMSKLSLRVPGVLIQISERLAVVYKFLTPVDTALLINSFQSLGFHDDAVLGMLMQHAAKSANRFDEMALTILFGSSSIHRLMTTPETSRPLLEKACKVNLSTNMKQKIVASLKRSSLPRELIQSSARRVAPELTSGERSAGTLQLEAA